MQINMLEYLSIYTVSNFKSFFPFKVQRCGHPLKVIFKRLSHAIHEFLYAFKKCPRKPILFCLLYICLLRNYGIPFLDLKIADIIENLTGYLKI